MAMTRSKAAIISYIAPEERVRLEHSLRATRELHDSMLFFSSLLRICRMHHLGDTFLTLTNPYTSTSIFQAKRQFLSEELLMKMLHEGIHEHNAKLTIVLQECP